MNLEVITGPMFSGKTTELLRLYKINIIANKKVILLKPLIDNRSGNKVSTHDNISQDAIIYSNLLSIDKSYLLSYDVICIDEGQFFEDLFEFIVNYIKYEKTFIIAGLTETFTYSILFENMVKVMGMANNIKRLLAICENCKKHNAIYTYKKNNNSNIIEIGGSELYCALCRSCYFSKI